MTTPIYGNYESILSRPEYCGYSESLAQIACLLVLHAGSALKKRVDKALQKHRLTYGRFSVLAQLSKQKMPLPVSTLASMSHVTSATISALLPGMVHDGLVERVPDASDRRIVRIALLPHGEHVLAHALSSILSLGALNVPILEKDELTSLVNILSKLSLGH